MDYLISLGLGLLAVALSWQIHKSITSRIDAVKKFTVDELAQFTKANIETTKRLTKIEKADTARVEAVKNIFKRISILERKDLKEPIEVESKQPVSIDAQIQRRKDFGKRVKNIRSRKNMSQLDLADKVQVYASNVHAWEKGKCLPRPDVLKELASVLNTTPEFLVNGANISPVAKAV